MAKKQLFISGIRSHVGMFRHLAIFTNFADYIYQTHMQHYGHLRALWYVHVLPNMWQFGVVDSSVGHINLVVIRQTWLVLGEMTACRVHIPVMKNLPQYNHLPSSTQSGHPSVSRRKWVLAMVLWVSPGKKQRVLRDSTPHNHDC